MWHLDWCGTWTRKHICIGGEEGSEFINFQFLYNYQEELAVYLLLCCSHLLECALTYTHFPLSPFLLLAAFLAPPDTPSFLSLLHVLAFNSPLASLKWKERKRGGEERSSTWFFKKQEKSGSIRPPLLYGGQWPITGGEWAWSPHTLVNGSVDSIFNEMKYSIAYGARGWTFDVLQGGKIGRNLPLWQTRGRRRIAWYIHILQNP